MPCGAPDRTRREINARSTKLAYAKDRFGLEGVTTILPRGSWTPLMYAARQGSLEAARVLADAGSRFESHRSGRNHRAGARDPQRALRYRRTALVEKGADPNIADSTGMAALYAAADMNTLGEIYGRPGRPSTDKLTALDLLPMLLAHGANPNAALKSPTLNRAHTPGEPSLGEGATPLMRAAKNGDTAAIRVLMANGADASSEAEERDHGADAGIRRRPRSRRFRQRLRDRSQSCLRPSSFWLTSGVDVNAANEADRPHCTSRRRPPTRS